jgi:1,4-dihydroxy-2-naphthoyl-CoA hydrolase
MLPSRRSGASDAARSKLPEGPPMTKAPSPDALNAKVPFAKYLGIRVTRAEPDLVCGELDVTENKTTYPGILHGGAIMAFADNLGALGTVINLPEGASGTTTLESKTNFMRAIPLGTTATAEARPVHKGRLTMVWRTDIFTADGKLAATVTQTQMVI